MTHDMPVPSLRSLALDVLSQPDPAIKAATARALHAPALGTINPGQHILPPAHPLPGRPTRPQLVSPNALKRRSVHTPLGRATLIHALAHIELNAIDLALDIVWRFSGLPENFYRDWLSVAAEEALHFELLRAHLNRLGFDYGDFPAHNGLWEMAEKTRDDVLARLALVPRLLEARGLDASPPIRAKLSAAGDDAGAAILDVILRDEIGHVAIGNHWFHHLCHHRQLDPLEHQQQLMQRYGSPGLKPPFNLVARRAAGFTEAEIDELTRHHA